MALKHEFNRQDGTDQPNPVLRLDAILTQRADRLAEGVKARLHISRQAQTLFLYLNATLAGLLYVVITREFFFLGIAFLAYMGSLPGRQRGSLVEEIQLEVTGLHKHTLKYLAVFVLAIGVFGVVTSLPFMVLGIASGAGIGAGEVAGIAGGMALIILKLRRLCRPHQPHRSRRQGAADRASTEPRVGTDGRLTIADSPTAVGTRLRNDERTRVRLCSARVLSSFRNPQSAIANSVASGERDRRLPGDRCGRRRWRQ